MAKPNGNGHAGNGHDPEANGHDLSDRAAAEIRQTVKEARADVRAFLRETREPQGAIELPDGRSIGVDQLGPQLLPGVWMEPERRYLVRRDRAGAYAADWWGFPIPLAYVCSEDADEGAADSAARVTLAWSTLPQFGQHTFTMRDVLAGHFLHAFGDPPFTTRRDLAFIVDVIRAQIGRLPIVRTPSFIGWSLSPTGERRFVLESRQAVWRMGDDGPQLEGAEAPDPPSVEDASHLVNAWSEWDVEGRGVACLAFAVRSAFASLRSVGTSLVLTGSTGSGKTTPARFTLGLFGAVKAKESPTTNFEASAAAMRAMLGRRYDHPTVVDDFHKAAVAGSGARVADHLDAMFRAIADGGPWSARGTRDGRLRDPVYLKAGFIFTGEELPGLLASAERRIAWVPYDRPIDSDTLYAQWDTLQAIWERIGHQVVRWAMPIAAHPEGGERLASLIEAIDLAWEESIYEAMRAARPDAPQKFARSIAGNWAAILAGAQIADSAIGAAEGDGPFVETLRPTLLAFALGQLDRLGGGAGATAAFDRTFVGDAIRGALEGDRYLFDAETNQPLASDDLADAPRLNALGYVWNGGLARFVPGRVLLGWRHAGRGEDWLLPDQVLEAMRRRARQAGLDFPFSPQTLPAHLEAIGYALPGDDGRHTAKPYVPGRDQVRVIRVPILDPDAEAEVEAARPGGVIPHPANSPRSPRSADLQAGRQFSEPTQSVKGDLPALPALPAVAARVAGARARESVSPKPQIEAATPPQPRKIGSGSRRGPPKPEKPTLIVDAGQLVIAEDGGQLVPESLPAALDPRKVKRRGNLGQLLDLARDRGAGRIVIARSWAEAAAAEGGGEGWTLSGAGRSQRATPAGGGAAIEVYLPDGSLGEADAAVIGQSLALFRQVTGQEGGRRGFWFRGGVGTFWQLVEALGRDARSVGFDQATAPADFPEPAHALPEASADLAFIRAPTDQERAARSCVVIDANSQYLRAMGGHAFGIGDPEHVTAPAFDPKRPGYWRATWRAPAWPATLPPPGYPLAEGKAGWLMTETLQLLAEAGAEVTIAEAWLWQGGRILDKAQRRLRDALYALKAEAAAGTAGAAEAVDMLKRTYKEGVGSMSRRENRALKVPHPNHRPHWRHAIIARSTALILRDLIGCGAHPVAIAVDGLAFLTPLDPDAFLGQLRLKIGDGLGRYKLGRSPAAGAMLDALAAWEGAGAPARNHATRAKVIGLITGNGGE